MSDHSPLSTVTITYQVDVADMARRGRLGAAATHSRHDGRAITAAARAANARKFPNAESKRAYFVALGKKSGEARRARKGATSCEVAR